MNKAFSAIRIIAAAALAALCLQALPAAEETVPLSSAQYASREEEMDAAFLASVSLFRQGKAKGGVVAFTGDMEYLGGYLAEGTPKGWFAEIPKTAVTVPMVIPTQAAVCFMAYLGDLETATALEEYGRTGPDAILISSADVSGQVVIEEQAHAAAKEMLEDSAKSHGLDIGPFYAIMEKSGQDEDSMAARIIAGEAPSAIVLEGMELMRKEKSSVRPWTEESGRIIAIALLSLAGLAFAGLAVIALMQKGVPKDEEDDS